MVRSGRVGQAGEQGTLGGARRGAERCGGGRNCEIRRRGGWRAEGHAEGVSLA